MAVLLAFEPNYLPLKHLADKSRSPLPPHELVDALAKSLR